MCADDLNSTWNMSSVTGSMSGDRTREVSVSKRKEIQAEGGRKMGEGGRRKQEREESTRKL